MEEVTGTESWENGNLVKNLHCVALCSSPHQQNPAQHTVVTPHVLIMGSWLALPKPPQCQARPWSSRNCSMVMAQTGSQHQGWNRSVGFPQSHEGGCGEGGDWGGAGHCGCLWFLGKGAQDWRHFAKPKQSTLTLWLSMLCMAHASTEIHRKLLHRMQWQCSQLSNKTYLSYIHPLNLGLPIFLHITKKTPCRLILEQLSCKSSPWALASQAGVQPEWLFIAEL